MKLVASNRRLLRWLRYAPDRLSHRVRRRNLLETLEHRGWPRSVLFVCHGNICRSPYAAAAFAQVLPENIRRNVRITSAGLIGPNRPVPPEAARVAGRKGLDLTNHRSELLSADHLGQAELVVVMDPVQRAVICFNFGTDPKGVLVLGDLDPDPIDRRAILDPIGQPEAKFEVSYDRIDRCLKAMVSAFFGESAATADLS